MACNKVFGIYELLEHIITFLPPRQILTAERVSKTWQAVINDSTRIAHARSIAPTRMLPQGNGPEYPLYAIGIDLSINPAFTPRSSCTFYHELNRGETIRFKGHTLVVEFPNTLLCKKAGLDQFLTSPPVRVLDVVVTFNARKKKPDVLKVKLESSTGLRVRDLEAVMKRKATNRAGVFDSWGSVTAVCMEEVRKPE